ncbi:MAG TPA: AbrB/MazE/SpoVT family DNA-binding domain-containing protein [Feifaniaceae bacterium]|nr:AbrB/MazE/SpoVT family DNA-binding domain-containing protein [Feifaniaceae bacterium]
MAEHTEKAAQEFGKYMSSVKVGPKGQIVIPKEARDMFRIKPGDTLLLLADASRGIAVQRQDYFDKIADEIFLRAAEDKNQSAEKEGGLRFAEAVKAAKQAAEEKKE